MSLHAISALTDAVDATKRLLWPFDRAAWFRLAVVMFFVTGAGLNIPNVPTGGGGGDPGTTGPDAQPGAEAAPTPEFTPELVGFLLAVLAAIVLFIVLLDAIAAVFEFVYVDALQSREVTLKAPFVDNWKRGLRLFGFRLSVNLLVFVGIPLLVGLLGVALGGWSVSAWEGWLWFLLFAVGFAVFLPVVLVQQAVFGFTNQFVVPIMLHTSRGVLSSWRRLLSTIRREPAEYVVYFVVSIIVAWVLGFVRGMLGFLVSLVLALPFLLLGIVPFAVLSVVGLGALVAAPLVILYAIVAMVAVLFIQIPLQTYLRYYSLLLLGDTDADLDLIPDLRREIRADGGEESGDEDDDSDDGGDNGSDSGDGDSDDGGSGGSGDGPSSGEDDDSDDGGSGGSGDGDSDDDDSGGSDDSPSGGEDDDSDDSDGSSGGDDGSGSSTEFFVRPDDTTDDE